MPNANGNDTQEMLWQVESELRQIGVQIRDINATIKPYLVELADLRDYHKQLLDLQESLQRRTIKPRIITVERKCTTKVTMPLDAQTQQLIDVLKGMSQDDLNKLCNQFAEQNGEDKEN
jgi:hypothetical protein